jgi:hypothetical protein
MSAVDPLRTLTLTPHEEHSRRMTSVLPHIAHPPSLVAIEVDTDRSLRIVLQEKTALGPEEPQADFDLGGREIVSGPDDGTFELDWEVVVCFAVRGDPFPTGRPSTETLTEHAEDSAFMQWVRSECYVNAEYVAAMHGAMDAPALPLRHFRVSCQEAQFDVAATTPPEVRRR